MLSDSHPRVREAALDQMILIKHSPEAVDQLFDSPLRLKAAILRFPSLIESNQTSIISSLCTDPEPALRKVIANHLDGIDWFSWSDVCLAAKESKDPYLLPRLLRSRREPNAEDMQFDLLKNGNDISRARMLEYLHGRPISESISELLPLLVDDSNPLVAQAASSLISDSKSLEGGI